MSTEKNEAVERRLYAEVWTKHNLDVIDELDSPDIVEHNTFFPGQAHGPGGHRQTIERLFSAFPDVLSTIEDLIVEGDKLVVRWTARGTHQGEFMGIPPTNKQVTSEGIDIVRFEAGKRVETWRQWDALGLLQQLGVVPPPRQPGS